MANPYQDVIDWLKSPEGEQWSEQRLEKARYIGMLANGQPSFNSTLVTYSARVVAHYGFGLAGVFSIKEQPTAYGDS